MKAPAFNPPCRACGRDLVSGTCSWCDKPVVEPKPITPSERVFRAVELNPGASSREVCAYLGVPDCAETDVEARRLRDVVISHLSRLVKRGALRAEGKRYEWMYYAADASRLPGPWNRNDAPKADEPKSTRRRAKAVRGQQTEKAIRKREYMAARRAALVAEGRCIGCRAKLMEGETSTRCPECRQGVREAQERYRQTEAGKRNNRDWKRNDYHANIEDARQERRANYERKKLAGECQSCVQPALDGYAYCAVHLEKSRESYRRNAEKRRAA